MDVNRQLVEGYLDAACKRVVLDGYLDGREDREGCEPGEERCEGCGIEAEAEDENTETINDIAASRSRSPPPPPSTNYRLVIHHQEPTELSLSPPVPRWSPGINKKWANRKKRCGRCESG